MSTRGEARQRALELLFESEQRDLDTTHLLAEHAEGSKERTAPPDYTVTLIEGVAARRERLDEVIASYAQGWTLERMPAVDRAALRIGTWEILFNDAVPDPVAIDEAVGLVRTYSTDDSPNFVNGVLGRIMELKSILL